MTLTRSQRLELGMRARQRVGRGELGECERKKRGFDPIDVLLKASVHRVQKLLLVKYKRMAASPFSFFRGAVSIMAADLSAHKDTGLTVQLCGDAHVQNLGSFEAPDGRIVLDINDFDETIPGPWEWDVKRMAASLVLAGMESEHKGSECSAAVEVFAGSYIRCIGELADEPVLVAARYQIHRLKKAQAVSAALRQAERAQPVDLLKKYTEAGARGKIRFRDVKDTLWRLNRLEGKEVLASLQRYRASLPPERLHLFDFFRPLDVAFKIVGTGSVGLRDYVVLMKGSGISDPLFLQIKQEVASAYAPYLKTAKNVHQGCRVVEGQHKIQPISDLMLGWTSIRRKDFLVRQLNDHKGTINLASLRGNGLSELASIAGELLARGHARSGDALAIKGYIGTPGRVIKSIVKYGTSYAHVTKADFELFQKAIAQKRIRNAA